MKAVSRPADGVIYVYDLTDPDDLRICGSFPAPDDLLQHAVSASHDLLIHADGEDLVAVEQTGAIRWRLPLDQDATAAHLAFAPDDRTVWCYVPEPDRLIGIATATGAVEIDRELPAAGVGGTVFPHPDGTHVLIDIGEGQDGSQILLYPPVRPIGSDDRALIALSPAGRTFQTVSVDQTEVSFHRFPGGEIISTLTGAQFEFTGGFLDERTAVVVIRESDEEYRHHRVDVAGGELIGEMPIATIDAYDLETLGDGTFLASDTDGRLRRYRA